MTTYRKDCTLCGISFTSKIDIESVRIMLNAHMQDMHKRAARDSTLSDVKQVCMYCGKKITGQYTFLRHLGIHERAIL